MKVRCMGIVTGNQNTTHITIGKTYDVIKEDKYCYTIKNNYGDVLKYMKFDFMPIDKWRDKVLNKLGI